MRTHPDCDDGGARRQKDNTRQHAHTHAQQTRFYSVSSLSATDPNTAQPNHIEPNRQPSTRGRKATRTYYASGHRRARNHAIDLAMLHRITSRTNCRTQVGSHKTNCAKKRQNCCMHAQNNLGVFSTTALLEHAAAEQTVTYKKKHGIVVPCNRETPPIC